MGTDEGEEVKTRLGEKVVAEISGVVSGNIVFLHYENRTFVETDSAESDIKNAEIKMQRETADAIADAIKEIKGDHTRSCTGRVDDTCYGCALENAEQIARNYGKDAK